MAEPPPPPRSPDCPPHEVTHAEVNIAQAAPPSPVRTDKAPVANLFGVLQGATKTRDCRSQGRRQVTHPQGKSTGTRRDVHLLLGRASQFRRPSRQMSTLHVNDLLSERIESLDHCQTMIITPDRDDDDDLRVDDSADNEEYDPEPIANPSPKSWPKKV